jgi:hypothetical protein
MNRKPRQHPVQNLGVYGQASDGCWDLAVMQLSPGVGLYHEHQLADMRKAEREYFFPYLLSVLAILGHQKEEQPNVHPAS